MKIPIPTEHEEQVTYFEWLQWAYPDVYEVTYAVPNGAHLARADRSWGKLEAEGAKQGIPDIIIDYPVGQFPGARIELKRIGGKVSPKQSLMLTKLQQQGFRVGICFGAEEAMSFTAEYLGTRWRVK